jgi:eukaryotic translation initiation factor 2C
LSTVTIEADYRSDGRRRYKIQNLTKTNAETTKFTQDDKTITTVKDYFLRTYNKRIQYPQLPLVACGANGKISIPMEFCTIRPGQRHIGKLNDAQTSDILKIAAVPPFERQQQIVKGRE